MAAPKLSDSDVRGALGRQPCLALDEDGAPVQQQGMAQPRQTPPVKRVHIKTFGCQMNVYDSERMTEALGTAGYLPVDDAAEADLVILNTCHIREKAAEKVYSELGRMRLAKEARRSEGRDTIIAVAGCVAQAEGREIMRASACRRSRRGAAELSSPGRASWPRRRPAAKASSPPTSRRKTNSRICRSARHRQAGLRPSSPCRKAATSSARSASCLTRGAPSIRARRRQIVAEAERLAAQGVREITLLGQNVNAYHGLGPDGRPWTLGAADAAARRSAGDRAPALHDQPSARHGRRADRAHRRRAQAHALSAPAVPVGLRPHPQGHEPQAHGRRLPGGGRPHARSAPRHRALDRHHRRLSRRDRQRVRRHLGACGAGRVSPRPTPSSTARVPERPRQASAAKCRKRRSTSACANCRA